MLCLLLVNAGYLAWSQDWLTALGPWASAQVHREPERLQRQVVPERIQLLNSAGKDTPPDTPPAAPTSDTTDAGNTADTANAAAAPGSDVTATAPAEAPPPGTPAAPGTATAATTTTTTTATATAPVTPPAPPEPTTCVQVGTFDEEQMALIKPALNAVLTAGGWETTTSVQPGRWIVYSGKLANTAALTARKAELRQMKVEFRDVNSAELQPGLVLGTFSSEAGGQQGLRDVTRKGVKGLQLLEIRPDITHYTLRLARATATQKQAVTNALAPLPGDLWRGKAFKPCT